MSTLPYYRQDRSHIALDKNTPVERTSIGGLPYNLESVRINDEDPPILATLGRKQPDVRRFDDHSA